MRLLLVEDDLPLGEGIRAGLTQEGYEVVWATSAEEAEPMLAQTPCDLMVLDLTLPGRSGLELMRLLRDSGNAAPILLLTARDTIPDRVRGLDAGADDYLTKPFDLVELFARLRALARRCANRTPTLLQVGEVALDPISRLVSHQGQPVDLSPREFALLHLLMENAGQALTRSRLEQALYGLNAEVESNTLEVFVHHLRRKLGGNFIRTIRGVGYLVHKP